MTWLRRYSGAVACDWQACGRPAVAEVRTDVPHKLTPFTTFYWHRCAEHTPEGVRVT